MNAAVRGFGVERMAAGRIAAAIEAPSWQPPTRTMLLLGLAGMLAGLWLDAGRLGLAWLEVWCGQGEAWTWTSIRLHWRELPAMHAGMLLGGLAASPWWRAAHRDVRPLPAALGCHLWCGVGMAWGMDAGAGLLRPPVGGAQALLAMGAGMAAGMLASGGLLRLGHALWRGRRPWRRPSGCARERDMEMAGE